MIPVQNILKVPVPGYFLFKLFFRRETSMKNSELLSNSSFIVNVWKKIYTNKQRVSILKGSLLFTIFGEKYEYKQRKKLPHEVNKQG